MASQPSTSGLQSRKEKRSYTLREAVELVQTEGSDVEAEEDDEESVFTPSEESEDDSIADNEPEVEEGGVASGADSDSGNNEREVGGDNEREVGADDLLADPSGDSFLQFITKPWHENFSFFPAIPPYSDQDAHGLHLQGMTGHAPISFYDAIFDDAIMTQIVVETNRYANQTIQAKGVLPPHSLFRKWKNTTVNEMNGFFAILIHMGLVHKPQIVDYWSTDPILVAPFAANIMSRDRFNLLLAMLHVSNNDFFIPRGQDNYNPLFKILPIYNHLREKFKTLYIPEEHICIDEAMCPWRGKLSFRVYMKDKPVKWGIKLYELCESSSAYVYDFEIYGGLHNVSNKPVDVVMRLAEPLLNKGRSIYIDNYYCCPELAEKLVQQDTHCVGTVRPNRKGMPRQLVSAAPPRGQVYALRQGAVGVMKWMDKKAVHLITTKMNPFEMEEVTTRTGRKMKPKAVQDYIINMAGVDHSDQLMAYMPLNRKTMKWWKKVFFHLFTLSLIQASILYDKYQRSQGGSKMPLKKFIVSVGKELNDRFQAGIAPAQAAAQPIAQPAAQPCPPGRVPTPQARLQGGHFSTVLPPRPNGRKNFRKCHVCTARRKRHPDVKFRESPNWCAKCGVTLCDKLCQGRDITCFQVYHTITDYVNY